MFVAKLISRGSNALSRLRVSRIVAMLSIVAGALVSPLAVAPAHARAGDITCLASAGVVFSPPLTAANTTAKVSFDNARLTSCTSTNGIDLTSGTATARGTATIGEGVDPCSLLLTIDFTADIHWTPT